MKLKKNILVMIAVSCIGACSGSKLISEKSFKFDELSINASTSSYFGGDGGPNLITTLDIKLNGLLVNNNHYKDQLGVEMYYPRGSFIYFPKKKQITIDLTQGSNNDGQIFGAVNTQGKPTLRPILGSVDFPAPRGSESYLQSQEFPVVMNNSNRRSSFLAAGAYFKDLNISYHYREDDNILIVDYEKERLFRLNSLVYYKVRELEDELYQQMPAKKANEDASNNRLKFSPAVVLGFNEDRSYVWTARIMPEKHLVYTCLEQIEGTAVDCKLIKVSEPTEKLKQIIDTDFIQQHSYQHGEYANEHFIDGRFSSFEVVQIETEHSLGHDLLPILTQFISPEGVGTGWRFNPNLKQSGIKSSFTFPDSFIVNYQIVNNTNHAVYDAQGSILKIPRDPSQPNNRSTMAYASSADEKECCIYLPKDAQTSIIKLKWAKMTAIEDIGQTRYFEKTLSINAFDTSQPILQIKFDGKNDVGVRWTAQQEDRQLKTDAVVKSTDDVQEDYCDLILLGTMTKNECIRRHKALIKSYEKEMSRRDDEFKKRFENEKSNLK